MDPKEQLTRLAAPVRASLEKHRLVWLVILAGLILLLLPSGKEMPQPEPQTVQAGFDLTAMEERLARALSRIDGAGEVTVVLTVRDGPRQVLAQDSREDQGETETVVISRGSSTQETVTVQELYPSYQGALLVCPGGDDPSVRLKLTEATSALTGLGADKISISKGK
ncbi:MAG: stage III sporulation protein AG [Ruminiclostridium sp.]|nr:stage III sporulation protein AG [Ruminiclostridium sp.]MBQ9851642.1 stage III sporulation protein AG [Ruminiclostridium sp.]MBQ9932528.1 stage III sporulation protein AG [Ruminiclostridium sp.]